MDPAEFDEYAKDYEKMHLDNIRITGEEPSYFSDYKIDQLRLLADGLGLQNPDVMDFGSGIGNSLPGFRRNFGSSRIVCADVSSESIDQARKLYPGDEEYCHIDGKTIPLPDDQFDLVFTACVFHHIPQNEHVHWFEEIRRVTRPGGKLVVFEHNPRNPLTVHAVNTCPFDVNARLIKTGEMRKTVRQAGWKDVKIDYHIFFPAKLKALRPLEKRLRWCGLGAQYMCVAECPG
ncbi:class I SAM-dependent methyltransferase [Aliiroseovarius sp. CAU 1755]